MQPFKQDFGRKTKGEDTHHSGEVFSSSLQLRPASSSPQAATQHLLSLDHLLLFHLKCWNFLPTAKLTEAQGWQWWSMGGENEEEKKEGERKKRGMGGEEKWRIYIPFLLSPQISYKPSTSLHTSPYFLKTNPHNTKEPETKPLERNKHQHTKNNRN